jgi:hypothetical protein
MDGDDNRTRQHTSLNVADDTGNFTDVGLSEGGRWVGKLYRKGECREQREVAAHQQGGVWVFIILDQVPIGSQTTFEAAAPSPDPENRSAAARALVLLDLQALTSQLVCDFRRVSLDKRITHTRLSIIFLHYR